MIVDVVLVFCTLYYDHSFASSWLFIMLYNVCGLSCAPCVCADWGIGCLCLMQALERLSWWRDPVSFALLRTSSPPPLFLLKVNLINKSNNGTSSAVLWQKENIYLSQVPLINEVFLFGGIQGLLFFSKQIFLNKTQQMECCAFPIQQTEQCSDYDVCSAVSVARCL